LVENNTNKLLCGITPIFDDPIKNPCAEISLDQVGRVVLGTVGADLLAEFDSLVGGLVFSSPTVIGFKIHGETKEEEILQFKTKLFDFFKRLNLTEWENVNFSCISCTELKEVIEIQSLLKIHKKINLVKKKSK
jgi:hypothetical protein